MSDYDHDRMTRMIPQGYPIWVRYEGDDTVDDLLIIGWVPATFEEQQSEGRIMVPVVFDIMTGYVYIGRENVVGVFLQAGHTSQDLD